MNNIMCLPVLASDQIAGGTKGLTPTSLSDPLLILQNIIWPPLHSSIPTIENVVQVQRDPPLHLEQFEHRFSEIPSTITMTRSVLAEIMKVL